jgi:hypothetical protein
MIHQLGTDQTIQESSHKDNAQKGKYELEIFVLVQNGL